MKFYIMLFSALLISSSNLSVLIIAAFADNNRATRQVRVTTGIGTVQGWEQGLVEKNPNLARWHWDPIYYYKQGLSPITQRNLKNDSRRTGKQANAIRPKQYQLSSPHETKPLHIPYPVEVTDELRGRLLLPKNSQENNFEHNETVLGKLMTPSTHGPHIASYNNLSSQGRSQDTAAQYRSQNTAVYGKLLSKGQANAGRSLKQHRTINHD